MKKDWLSLPNVIAGLAIVIIALMFVLHPRDDIQQKSTTSTTMPTPTPTPRVIVREITKYVVLPTATPAVKPKVADSATTKTVVTAPQNETDKAADAKLAQMGLHIGFGNGGHAFSVK